MQAIFYGLIQACLVKTYVAFIKRAKSAELFFLKTFHIYIRSYIATVD